jgi:hypothetical protein
LASNTQGVLDEVWVHFTFDTTQKPAAWMDTAVRKLGVMINVCLDQVALSYLIGSKKIVKVVEGVINGVVYKKDEKDTVEMVGRIMNLLSKISKDKGGAQEIAESKNLVLRILLYFNKSLFPQDLVLNSLRTLHNIIKTSENFRNLFLE